MAAGAAILLAGPLGSSAIDRAVEWGSAHSRSREAIRHFGTEFEPRPEDIGVRWGNGLYDPRGDGTFEDVAEHFGATDRDSSFPCWFWDFDNDGPGSLRE
jgi:hypothetical protein